MLLRENTNALTQERRSMTVSFDAETLIEELVADNDPPYLHVGMADADNSHYVMLHRSQPFGDPEDWGVYVEVNDQDYSGFDRIASCELSRDRMLVRMSEPLGSNLPVESVEVKFKPGRRPSSEFVARLRAIFTGREELLHVDGSGR
jgi:hypothetical protein